MEPGRESLFSGKLAELQAALRAKDEEAKESSLLLGRMESQRQELARRLAQEEENRKDFEHITQVLRKNNVLLEAEVQKVRRQFREAVLQKEAVEERLAEAIAQQDRFKETTLKFQTLVKQKEKVEREDQQKTSALKQKLQRAEEELRSMRWEVRLQKDRYLAAQQRIQALEGKLQQKDLVIEQAGQKLAAQKEEKSSLELELTKQDMEVECLREQIRGMKELLESKASLATGVYRPGQQQALFNDTVLGKIKDFARLEAEIRRLQAELVISRQQSSAQSSLNRSRWAGQFRGQLQQILSRHKAVKCDLDSIRTLAVKECQHMEKVGGRVMSKLTQLFESVEHSERRKRLQTEMRLKETQKQQKELGELAEGLRAKVKAQEDQLRRLRKAGKREDESPAKGEPTKPASGPASGSQSRILGWVKAYQLKSSPKEASSSIELKLRLEQTQHKTQLLEQSLLQAKETAEALARRNLQLEWELEGARLQKNKLLSQNRELAGQVALLEQRLQLSVEEEKSDASQTQLQFMAGQLAELKVKVQQENYSQRLLQVRREVREEQRKESMALREALKALIQHQHEEEKAQDCAPTRNTGREASLQRQIGSLRVRLQEASRVNSTYELNYQVLLQRHQDLKRLLVQRDSQLSQQMSLVKAASLQSVRSMQEVTGLRAELEASQQQCRAIQSQLQALGQVVAEHQRLAEETIAAAQSKEEHWAAQVEKAKKEIVSALSQKDEFLSKTKEWLGGYGLELGESSLQQFSQLRRNCMELRVEKQELKHKMDEADEAIEALRSQIVRLKADLQTELGANVVCKKQSSELRAQLSRLQLQLNTFKTTREVVQAKSQQVVQTQDIEDQLKRQLGQLQVSCSGLEQKLFEREMQCKRHQFQLQVLKQLQAEVAALRQKQAQNRELKQAKQQLEQSLQQLKQSQARVQQKLEGKQIELQDASFKYLKAEEDKEKLQAEFNFLAQETKVKHQSEVKQMMAAWQKKTAQNQDQLRQLNQAFYNKLCDQRQELSQKIGQAEDRALANLREAERWKSEAEVKHFCLNKLEQILSELKQKEQSHSLQLQEQSRIFQERLNSKNEQSEELARRRQAELIRLGEHLAAKSKQLIDLGTELDCALRSNEEGSKARARLESELRLSRQNEQMLQERVRELQQAKAEVKEEAERRRQELRSRLKRAHSEREKHRLESSQSLELVSYLEGRVESLSSEIEDRLSEVRAQQHLSRVLEGQNQALKRGLREVKEAAARHAANAAGKLQQLQSQVDELCLYRDLGVKLRDLNLKLEEEARSLRAERQRLSTQSQQLRANQRDLVLQVESLLTQLAAQGKDLASAQALLGQSRSEAARLEANRRDYQQRNARAKLVEQELRQKEALLGQMSQRLSSIDRLFRGKDEQPGGLAQVRFMRAEIFKKTLRLQESQEEVLELRAEADRVQAFLASVVDSDITERTTSQKIALALEEFHGKSITLKQLEVKLREREERLQLAKDRALLLERQLSAAKGQFRTISLSVSRLSGTQPQDADLPVQIGVLVQKYTALEKEVHQLRVELEEANQSLQNRKFQESLLEREADRRRINEKEGMMMRSELNKLQEAARQSQLRAGEESRLRQSFQGKLSELQEVVRRKLKQKLRLAEVSLQQIPGLIERL